MVKIAAGRRRQKRTFVAIPNRKEVHVVVFVIEEQQTDP